MLSMDRQYLKAGSLAEEEDTCVRRRIHVICYPWRQYLKAGSLAAMTNPT